MVSIRSINPVVRAVGVIGAVMALATGVTFAALQSQATLTNNTIASATATLQVDNTDSGANPFSATDVGYAFSGVVPGGATSSTGNFQLKNAGTVGMTVSVKVDSAPTWTVADGVGTVDNNKVKVLFQRGAGVVQEITLNDLLSGDVPLTDGNLAPGAVATFHVQIKMDADAFTGSGATADNFDFVFSGTGV